LILRRAGRDTIQQPGDVIGNQLFDKRKRNLAPNRIRDVVTARARIEASFVHGGGLTDCA
jgi:hypothetical protein